jgi:ABC-type Mn2+/Zn2+ transport system permease subunit
VLVSALLVIPGATAQNLTRHIRSMVAASTATAAGAMVGGLWLSYLIDFPSGATIVLLLALLYLLTTSLGPWLRGGHVSE